MSNVSISLIAWAWHILGIYIEKLLDMSMHKNNVLYKTFFFTVIINDSLTGCLDFSTKTAKVDCVVPVCSEMERVPSFLEEFSSTIHNCEIDDEVERITCFQVEPSYIPRNVDRREARR